jgi:uncharacterized protein with HEPN domain
MQDILDAIARARLADRRMRLAESLVDEAGVQIAFQAILYNRIVIGEAVKAIPAEILERDPDTPWAEFAAMPGVLSPNFFRIEPESVHRAVEEDLGPLDLAVRRLRTAG